MGRIEYARQRLRCRGCGEDVYPLDAALGLLPGSGSTLGVRERALWAAVEVSYAKAGIFLEKFAGLEVSHGSIHRWAQEEGRLVDLRERAQEAVFGRTRAGVGSGRPVPHGSTCRSTGRW